MSASRTSTTTDLRTCNWERGIYKKGGSMQNMDNRIKEVTGAILNDYSQGRYIDKENNFSQPEKEAVVDIIEKLQKIIFPGFYRMKDYRYYTVESMTSTLVEDVLFNLIKQITLSLRYSAEYCGLSDEETAEKAHDQAFAFMERIPGIREYVDTDLTAEYDGDPAAYSKDEIVYSYPGFYAIVVYRIAHELVKLGVSLIPRMMTEHAHSLTGIDINPGATIGKYFFIDHGTGIVIGETTEIGEHVKLYQGVTLGALSTRKGQLLKGKKRHPTIEDNVTIYSGASILGGETVIGANSVIGANAFITTSVPAGAKISIKNQEMNCEDTSKKNLDNGENWFYII